MKNLLVAGVAALFLTGCAGGSALQNVENGLDLGVNLIQQAQTDVPAACANLATFGTNVNAALAAGNQLGVPASVQSRALKDFNVVQEACSLGTMPLAVLSKAATALVDIRAAIGIQ